MLSGKQGFMNQRGKAARGLCEVKMSSLKIKHSPYEDKLTHKGQCECVRLCVFLPLCGPNMSPGVQHIPVIVHRKH